MKFEKEYIQTVMRKEKWEYIIRALLKSNNSELVGAIIVGLESIKYVDDIPYDELDNELLVDLAREKKELEEEIR